MRKADSLVGTSNKGRKRRERKREERESEYGLQAQSTGEVPCKRNQSVCVVLSWDCMEFGCLKRSMPAFCWK